MYASGPLVGQATLTLLSSSDLTGRYVVRCFVGDRWRTVAVDDWVPVDFFGQPMLVCALPLQLWPLLLTKAVFKLMSAFEVTHSLVCLHELVHGCK